MEVRAGDPLAQGKRKCKSLREKEREVQRNIDDGIVPHGGHLTVLALTKKYILQKEVASMCNLSQGIREDARAETQAEIIMNMYRNGFTIEQIELAVRKSAEEIRAIIEKREPVLA